MQREQAQEEEEKRKESQELQKEQGESYAIENQAIMIDFQPET